MLVFTDLGLKKDAKIGDRMICVSVVIFKQVRYKQFVRPWERMLKAWNATAFHATDFYNGAGEFKRKGDAKREALFADDSKRIPTMIGKTIRRAILVAFNPEEYRERAPTNWINLFGNSVHSMAIQIALLEIGWWAEEKCPSERFTYFMESGDADEGKVAATVSGMRNDPATSKVIRVQAFNTTGKGAERGLEAADFFAWQWNKYFIDRVRTGRPDDPRKDFAAVVEASRNQVSEYRLTEDNLKLFFASVPPEVLRRSGDDRRQRGECESTS